MAEFQLGHGRGSPIAPPSSDGSLLYHPHGHGGHRQQQENREGWQDTSHYEPAMPPWLSRAQSQGSLPLHDPSSQSGFMLATNIPTQQHQPPAPGPFPLFSLSPSTSSASLQPSEASSAQLWGEPQERGGGGVAGKQPMRPLWREGWRAETVTCSVPRLHQYFSAPPSQEDLNGMALSLDHPRDCHGRNLVLTSVDLQHHIQDIQQASQMEGSRLLPHDLRPIPQRFGNPEVKTTPSDLLKVQPISHPTLNLDPSSLALLLRKSTAAICCHSGYHSTSLRALDTLAGAMGDFLHRFCQQICIHRNQQQEGGGTGFQSALERSLWECGIKGRADLHQFWKTAIESRALQLQQTAARLHEEPPQSSQPPSLLQRRQKDSLDLRLLNPWPPDSEKESGEGDEEISLEDALNASVEIGAPAIAPTPGAHCELLETVVHATSLIFSQFSDSSTQDPDGFILLTPDGPARKRLRTNSFGD